jgi:hypothetical protein
MDIVDLILDDHAELRRLFAMIDDIDPKQTEALEAIWARLGTMLDAHAEAEELFFYPTLLKRGKGANDADSAEEETEDAIEDHNKIRDAVAEAGKHKVGSKAWYAAVCEANKENGDHLAEEERQAMADFRKQVPLEQRHALAVKFITFRFQHLESVDATNKDADGYIAQHKRGKARQSEAA